MSEPITRRTFLAATGVAAALARVRAASPWPIGVESYCFHDVDFATTIARTKQLGLKAIELHDGHLPYDSTPAALASAKQAFAAAGIAVEALAQPATSPALRQVLDRVLDGVDGMLAVADELPRLS